MRSLGALAATIAITALAAAWPASPARAVPLVGVEESFLGASAATQASVANSLFPPNATNKTARIFACWCEMETVGGAQDFRRVTGPVQALLRHGIRPIIAVIGAPDAYSSACNTTACLGPPDQQFDSRWSAFWGALTRTVASSTAPESSWPAALEVWNEPNLAQFYTGGPNPARYAELLKLAYTAVKGANAKMPVLGGSLASHDATDAVGMADREFLTKMYQDPSSPAKQFMDGISMKSFAGFVEPWTLGVRQNVDRIRAVRNAHNDAGKPIWITNTGLSTSGSTAHALATPANQGIGLASHWRALSGQPDIAAIVFFRLLDLTSAPDLWERGLGLYSDLNTPKPGLTALKAALAAAPYPQPTVQATAEDTTIPVGGTAVFHASGFPSYPGSLGTPVYHWDTDGNGFPEDTTVGTAARATRRYTRAGTYKVGLTVNDRLEQATGSVTITVSGVGTGGGGTGGGTGGSGTGPLKLTSLKVLPSAFRAAKSGPSIVTRGGTRVSFTSTRRGGTKFTFKRVRPGRIVSRRCRAQTRANRRARACNFLSPLRGIVSRFTRVGTNSFRFSGRVSGRSLSRGRYQLVATTTAAGQRATRTVLFRITG